MPLMPDTRLGHYVILSLIGAGGMGEVYRARDTQLGRDVAIKVLPAFLSNDPNRLRRFEQEARAAAALNHPNILAVYQMGAYEGSPYLVSELLEGATLRDLMKGGPLSSRKAIDYGTQIAHGLAAAHDKGIVHRDLKPENLFVTKGGRAKILDFGLAKLMQPHPQFDETLPTMGVGTETGTGTDPGMVMGTVGYMSPEQVRGLPADHRADIFAFGAVLYEMLSGQRAFKKPTVPESMTAILNEEPSGMAKSMNGLSPGLLRLVHRCLEKVPEQRFQSASDMAFALEALSDSGSSSITKPAEPAASRKIWTWIGAAAAATVIAAGLLAWWMSAPAVPVVDTITQLTDDGQPKSGTLVTDGSRIYFNEGLDGSEKIMQVAVTGGEAAAMPTRLANPLIEALSPDNSQLLLGVGIFPQQVVPLWTMPLPAGEPRRLGKLYALTFRRYDVGRIRLGSEASYKPDGRIVAALGDGMYLADADGSNSHRLFPYSSLMAGPSFSPDGRHIVFYIRPPGDSAPTIIETDPTGSAFHSITKPSGDGPSCCAQWTPDGRYLVAQGGSAGRSDLWAIPMERGWLRHAQPPSRLTNGPLSFEGPVPGRDGRHIFAIGKKERGELVRYDVKSKQYVQLLSGVSGLDPTYSRDGQWVAYLSYPDGMLWRSRSDGTDRLQLTYPPMTARTPRISPDGKRVSFDYQGEIYVASMEGGTPEKVVAGTQDSRAVLANWSPDGNLLQFIVVIQTRHEWRTQHEWRILDLNSGKIAVVPSSRDLVSGVFVAQDKLATVSAWLQELLVLDLKTGKRTDLLSANLVNWTPSRDLKSMYVTTGGSNPMAMRVRIADGKVDKIVDLTDLRRVTTPSMGVGPDDSLIFTRDIGTQEIYSISVKWP